MRRLKRMVAAALLAALGAAGAAATATAQGAGPAGATASDFYGGPLGDDPGSGPGFGGFAGGRGRRTMGPFETYRGFRIDLAEARGVIDVPSAVAEVENQIDIVDRAGVDPAIMAVFQTMPIRISPFFGGGGHYSGGPEVTLSALGPDDERPVLLHEYMHVLEYRRFPGGFRNPTVGRFYAEARAQGLYPPDAYMMSNPAEFFAVTASCYLNGTVARDPYTRAAIRERQPDYYVYLVRLFGPRNDGVPADAPAPATAAR